MTGTVSIKGVAYETVHARLEAAHDTNARPKGIRSIATSPMELAGRIVVCATVTFDDGREFSGISEAKLDATSGADRDAPVECAETSAVGRALANAGYFGSGGLASQDEIRSAQARGSRFNRPPQNTTARPVPQDGTPRLAQGLEGPADDAPPRPAGQIKIGNCRSCGETVAFRLNPSGKWSILNVDAERRPTEESHFGTCPNAEDWKGGKRPAGAGR